MGLRDKISSKARSMAKDRKKKDAYDLWLKTVKKGKGTLSYAQWLKASQAEKGLSRAGVGPKRRRKLGSKV